MNEKLSIKLNNLVSNPGTYLMKDKNGQIIYVGKAKNLKSRVSSYFTGAHDYKVSKMISLIDDFDIIVTKSEKEALILELNLIKEHKPRFNIMFMDDKVYPYIKVTDEKWPRLVISRNRKKDEKGLVFGPYPDSGAARKMIDLLNRIYPIRKCSNMAKKACLYYHLGQCLGMCEFDVDPKIYYDMMDEVIKILKGDTKDLLNEYINKQKVYIEEMKFELAADAQKIIDAINHVSDKQQVQSSDANAQIDVFNYQVYNGYISFVVLIIRNGKIINNLKHFAPLYESPQNALISYINQYYQQPTNIDQILIPFEFSKDEFIDKIKNKVFRPQRGNKLKFLNLALENAKVYIQQQFDLINTSSKNIEKATKELDEILEKSIISIEMFDVSHISNTNTVAGMVYFSEGVPDKNQYRLYRLSDNQGDTKSMQEVIYRRYFRLLNENLLMPDLIIVDGGIQQVNAAKEVLDSLNLDILVIGLAKDQYHNTNEIVLVNKVIKINKESQLFFFLTRMQDEVHRFAINYHKKLRSKSQTRSILDDIKGIGPVRKQELLKKFENIDNIKQANINELLEVLPLEVAQNLIDYFDEIKY